MAGLAVLFTADDGDLTTVAWVVWILSWLAAAIIAVVGLALGAIRFVHNRRA